MSAEPPVAPRAAGARPADGSAQRHATSAAPPWLPPQVRVFERDWLSANNLLLAGRDGHVLVDTGYATHADLTLALVAGADGLAGAPLALVVNTHGHSDHVGGNAALVRRYGCPVAFPANEAPAVARWDGAALLYDYADQRVERFRVDRTIEPGSRHDWGDLEWQALAAPGHDMGALVFFNPEHAILIAGDALWRDGFGFVMPRAIDREALPATRATLDLIAALGVRTVIPGHGAPFVDVDAALKRAYARLAALEADDGHAARHALKVVLAFHLLDCRRMPKAALPDYVARIGIYRDLNAAVLRLSPSALAAMLVASLARAGALREDGDDLVA
jgi:glyoxylase-like metal-dependent hydrolase (beta-lactamase superfamily II)